MTRCHGTLGRRAKAPRSCPSSTKHPSGLCSLCRQAGINRATKALVSAAIDWRSGMGTLSRLEACTAELESIIAGRYTLAGQDIQRATCHACDEDSKCPEHAK